MPRSLLLALCLGLLCSSMAVRAVSLIDEDGNDLDVDDDGLLDEDKIRFEEGWADIADLLSQKNGTGLLWTAIDAAAAELGDLAAAVSEGNTTATIFAPSDEAFLALGDEALQALLAKPAELAEIIKYHIIPGMALTLADIKAADGEVFQTAVEGATGMLKVKNGIRKAALQTTSGQEVQVYQYNMGAGNAIVHTIKDILLPGDMVLTADGMAPAPARR